MKAKRLTALALAALMAASTTSVALAVKVDENLVFAEDGYYKYNSDSNRIESVDRRDDYKPGDEVYLRLESAGSLPKEQTYNVYADWTIGDNWVKDVEIDYRKGDVTTSTSTTYDWIFTGTGILTGWTAGNKGLTSKDEAAIKAGLKGDTAKVNQYAAQYLANNYKKIEANTAFTDSQGRYFKTQEDAEKTNGIAEALKGEKDWYINNVKTDYTSKEELIAGKQLVNIQGTHWIYGGKVHGSVADLITAGLSGEEKKIYVSANNETKNTGTDFKENSGSGYEKEITAYVFNNGAPKYVKKDSAVTYEELTALGISELKKGSDHTADYYAPNGDYVANSSIEERTTYGGYNTPDELRASKGIKKRDTVGYVANNDLTKFDETAEATSKTKVEEAIDASTIVWKTNTVTNTTPQYEYWVKITTKGSDTTKDIDVVGNLYVGEGSSKNSIKKDGDKLSVDFTLTNSDPGNGSYDGASDSVYIDPDTRAVVKFADDASDEFEVEFGDDARFVFNARGQSKLNLAYNTKYDKDFAYDYDDANIDFLTFEGEPTTNRTGTLYIYADEDSYIYEVTPRGAKKINGAKYNHDEGAWEIRTRHLTSYAISDKKLKTVDQMENSSSSNSSNKPGNNKPGSNKPGNNNDKPNPDTGR